MNNAGDADVTLDDIGNLAMLLAEKTSLGALCSNMEIRCALEFLKGRGYLVKPTEDHPFACAGVADATGVRRPPAEIAAKAGAR
jgi:hypothetical protein